MICSVKNFDNAMQMALNAAEQFLGATAPNPPVGCIALDKNGKVLLGAGHRKAGEPHAEASVLQLAKKLGVLQEIETLVVTLEPCNHHGRTPPCTEAILANKNIRRVVFGAKDPNPNVKGSGEDVLRGKGVEVISGVLKQDCEMLIRAFAKWSRTGTPYITVKTVHQADGSMIPPKGEKTFSRPESLVLAHELRKRADAILTGSGTVIADNPEFTVRHIPDHPGKKRWLLVADRRGRIDPSWLRSAEAKGFQVRSTGRWEEELKVLGKQGVLELLPLIFC